MKTRRAYVDGSERRVRATRTPTTRGSCARSGSSATLLLAGRGLQPRRNSASSFRETATATTARSPSRPDDETIERIQRLAALRAASATRRSCSIRSPAAVRSRSRRRDTAARPIANELNPVAAAILEGTVALASRARSRVREDDRVLGNACGQSASRSGSIRSFRAPRRARAILGYIWAHTVPCPTTGLPTPLAPTSGCRGATATTPQCGSTSTAKPGAITPTVVRGDEAGDAGPRSTYKNGTATSVWTDETFSGDYIRERARAGDWTDAARRLDHASRRSRATVPCADGRRPRGGRSRRGGAWPETACLGGRRSCPERADSDGSQD